MICDATPVTVRYDESDSFELFGKKLCRFWGQALMPDAIAVGLVDTIINMSARALGRVGDNLDRIGSAVFKAPGDNSKRSAVYSATLDSLGREDGRNLKSPGEPALEIERLLLFLSAEGKSGETPRRVCEATKAALRDLQSLEEDASFRAQRVRFLLDATLGFINLAQNDIIKLFSVLAVIFMPPNHDRLDLRHEFQDDARARMALRLSSRACADGAGRRRTLSLFLLEEVAVSLRAAPMAGGMGVRRMLVSGRSGRRLERMSYCRAGALHRILLQYILE